LKRGNKSKNHRYTKVRIELLFLTPLLHQSVARSAGFTVYANTTQEVSCTSTSEVTFDEKFKFEVTLYHSKDKDNKAIYVPKKILSFAAKEVIFTLTTRS
jgi:hypothetical protein